MTVTTSGRCIGDTLVSLSAVELLLERRDSYKRVITIRKVLCEGRVRELSRQNRPKP